MSTSAPRNIGHSVFTKLKDQARERGEDFNHVLQRYGIERLLYRLSVSQYRENFILKGASMLMVWLGQEYRTTRDADLLGFGDPAPEHIRKVFQELCRIEPAEPDGIEISADSVSVEPIREERAYGGQQVTLRAALHTASIALQVDLGFGDVVTPGPDQIEYPTRLEFPAPKLRAYPKETLVAEKLEAMVSLGMANSRLKDFYDIWILSRKLRFDGSLLQAAIQATFSHRQTRLPVEAPAAFSKEFAEENARQAQWKAFLTRHALEDSPQNFEVTISSIRDFLQPVMDALTAGEQFSLFWEPDNGWSSRRRS